LNGVASILSLVVNMVVSFFLLKSFGKASGGKPSKPKKPKSEFSNFRNLTPVPEASVGPWQNDMPMGDVFYSSMA
jgi:hypothetical protein